MEPLKRSIEKPLRPNLTRAEAWLQEGKGLIRGSCVLVHWGYGVWASEELRGARA